MRLNTLVTHPLGVLWLLVVVVAGQQNFFVPPTPPPLGSLFNRSDYVFPVSATTSTSSTNFGRVPMTTWNAKIDYGEDLYFGKDFFCSGINYEKRRPTCIPCNYSGAFGRDGCLDENLNVRDLPQLTEEERETLPDCECDRSFCSGDIIKQGEDPVRVISSRDIGRTVLRYEHTDWETGFTVLIDPIVEGPTDIIVTTKAGTSAHDMISHMYFMDKNAYSQACPSHPRFGPSAESITYFIIVLASGSEYAEIDVSIMLLPPLQNEQPSVRASDLLVKNEGEFPWIEGEIGDPPLEIRGLDMLNAYGDDEQKNFWTIGKLYNLDRCRTLSFHLEILQADYSFDYFGQWSTTMKLWKKWMWEEARKSKFRPYKFEEHIYSTAKEGLSFPMGSLGKVISVCPWDGEPTYLHLGLTASVNFPNWTILMNVQDITNSPHFEKFKIGSLTPFAFSSNFHSSLYLSCPCRECDDCGAQKHNVFFQPWWNRVTKISRDEIRDFFALSKPGCDLAIEIGDRFNLEGDEAIQFRCAEIGLDTTCGMSRVVPVTEQFPKFYPYPEILRVHDPLYSPINADITESGQFSDSSLGMVVVTTIDNKVLIDPSRFRDCSLVLPFLSEFFLEDFRHPLNDFGTIGDTFRHVQPQCEADAFRRVSAQIKDFGDSLFELVFDGVAGNPLPSEYSPHSLLYGAYALTLTEAWQGCQNLMTSLSERIIDDVVVIDSKQCHNFDPEDPCCNQTIEWETCCEERNIVLYDQDVPTTINEQEINNECVDSACVETFVDDYVSLELQIKFSDLCNDPGVFVDPDDLNLLVSNCKKEWIGDDDLKGFSCSSHSDCQKVANQECNFYEGVCQGGREDLELGFLTCLLTNMGSVERTTILSEIRRSGFFEENNDIYFGEEEILTPELLRDFVTIGEECVSDKGPMSPHRVHYAADSLVPLETSLCSVCFDVWCLTTLGCDLPLQCYDYRSSCTPTLVQQHNNCVAPTAEDHVCNWDPSLNEQECGTDYHCMYCFNSSFCVPLPASTREECEQPVCISGTGEVSFMSEDECENTGFCSENCNGNECENQKECEKIGGRCSDNEEIVKTVEAAAERSEDLRVGAVCLHDINPFNYPSCPFSNEGNLNYIPFRATGRQGTNYDFTTRRGCVFFSNCSLHNFWYGSGPGYFVPNFCVPSFANESQCEKRGGTWLQLPLSDKNICEGKKKCSEPGLLHLTDKDEEECAACGGSTVNTGMWSPGVWRSATSSLGQWRKAEMRPTYHLVNNSISFVKLNNVLSSTLKIADSLATSADFSCRLSPFLSPLRVVSCYCEEDSTDSDDQEREDCVSDVSGEDDIIGDVLFCPGVGTEVGLSVGQLIVEGDWIRGDFCRLYRVALADTAAFVGNREREPLTTLTDPNSINQYPVRNSNGASVGRVVADGLKFVESIGFVAPAELKKVHLRINLFDELENIPSDYYIDLGIEVLNKKEKYVQEEIELRPLNAKLVSEGNGRVGDLVKKGKGERGVVVELEWESPLVYGEARVYVIAKKEDWEDEDAEDVLSEGERILLYVFCALYGASFIAGFVFFTFSFSAAFTNVLLFLFVELTFLLRSVYLGIFASGYLQEEQTVAYILVEPPSFFILSISSIILLSFSFVLYFAQHSSPPERIIKRFWIIFWVGQAILYTILIIVLITLSTIDHEDEVTVDCFGRSADVEQSFSVEAIRIAYHALLFCLGLAFSCAILFIESAIHKLLRIRSLLVLSVLAVASVLLTNLLWVIYSSLRGSSPYFVIPLFFTEAVPLLVICVWVRPKGGIKPSWAEVNTNSSENQKNEFGAPDDSTSLFL